MDCLVPISTYFEKKTNFDKEEIKYVLQLIPVFFRSMVQIALYLF